MKNRNKKYFNERKAMNVVNHVLEVDLTTFLKATFQLAKNKVVKDHIKHTINNLSVNPRQIAA